MATTRRARGRVAAFAILMSGVAGSGVMPVGAQAPPPPVAQLSVVRVGNDGSFDRVVFEFTGDTVPTATISDPVANTGSVPGDPSGQPVPVDGAQVVLVHLTPAIATNTSSNPPGPLYTGPTSIHPAQTTNVVHVALTGDFESTLSWAIGIDTATGATVRVATDPIRVVIDIPHAVAQTATTTTIAPAVTPGGPGRADAHLHRLTG